MSQLPRSALHPLQRCPSLTPWPPAVVQGRDQRSSFLETLPLSPSDRLADVIPSGWWYLGPVCRKMGICVGWTCLLHPCPSSCPLRGRQQDAPG